MLARRRGLRGPEQRWRPGTNSGDSRSPLRMLVTLIWCGGSECGGARAEEDGGALPGRGELTGIRPPGDLNEQVIRPLGSPKSYKKGLSKHEGHSASPLPKLKESSSERHCGVEREADPPYRRGFE
ncbi:hypothetical protein NDU88_005020 [Pleurodeles waltl]|uniref:Uncharacterized protein n=1 Tax=Pleurodeles waltl TaxID=8319 RepID=A0AAV7M8Q9_PLEWA|nr:hypothetical protein NDU88_005020 [Pleurodeles waltl]